MDIQFISKWPNMFYMTFCDSLSTDLTVWWQCASSYFMYLSVTYFWYQIDTVYLISFWHQSNGINLISMYMLSFFLSVVDIYLISNWHISFDIFVTSVDWYQFDISNMSIDTKIPDWLSIDINQISLCPLGKVSCDFQR